MKRLLFSVLALAAFCVYAGSAGAVTYSLNYCVNKRVYVNPNPGTCVTVRVRDSGGTGSLETMTIVWSTGGSTNQEITPTADPWTIICSIAEIWVHEHGIATSSVEVT